MKQQTINIRKSIHQYEDQVDRIKHLKDSYKDDIAYIITAGPTLKNHDIELLNDKLKDKLVICVKQTLNQFNSITDFHLLNFCNYEQNGYSYDRVDTIPFWTYWEEAQLNHLINSQTPADFILPIFRNGKIENSVTIVKDFDTMMFENRLDRVWGPGVMHELAFPLCIHLGVKKIVTIGWDIGNLKQNENGKKEVDYSHYYDDSKQRIMPTGMPVGELEAAINSSEDFYIWLKSKNIELNVVSDTNPIHKSIPRINIKDI